MIETFQKIFHFSEKRTRILWESIIFNIVHSVFDIMQFAALYLALNAVFDDSIKNAGLKSMILVLISSEERQWTAVQICVRQKQAILWQQISAFISVTV